MTILSGPYVSHALPRACVALGIVLFMSFPVVVRAQDQRSQGTVVRVTGHGVGVYEARQDAIRQALQQATRQLIIAQRVVSKDVVLVDTISSAMNGYVNGFTTRSVTADRGGVSVVADIDVSLSRIENFVRPRTNTVVAATDLDNLLAAATAQQEVRRERGQFFAALLRDMPLNAVNITTNKVGLAADSDGYVSLDLTIQTSPLFINNLKAGLKELGGRQIASTSRVFRDFGLSALNNGRVPETARGLEANLYTLAVCFERHDEDETTILPAKATQILTGRAAFGGDCWRAENVNLVDAGWSPGTGDYLIRAVPRLLVQRPSGTVRLMPADGMQASSAVSVFGSVYLPATKTFAINISKTSRTVRVKVAVSALQSQGTGLRLMPVLVPTCRNSTGDCGTIASISPRRLSKPDDPSFVHTLWTSFAPLSSDGDTRVAPATVPPPQPSARPTPQR